MDMPGANNYGGGGIMNDKTYDTMTGPSVTATTARASTAATYNISTATTENMEAIIIPENPYNPHDILAHLSSTGNLISDHYHHHHRRPLPRIPDS